MTQNPTRQVDYSRVRYHEVVLVYSDRVAPHSELILKRGEFYRGNRTVGELDIDGKKFYGLGHWPGTGPTRSSDWNSDVVLKFILQQPGFGFSEGFIGQPLPGKTGGLEESVRLGYNGVWLHPSERVKPQRAFDKFEDALNAYRKAYFKKDK